MRVPGKWECTPGNKPPGIQQEPIAKPDPKIKAKNINEDLIPAEGRFILTSSSSNIIFGLKDYPRPKQSGFFYQKPPTLFGNFQIRTLAVLDLFITDENYLLSIFTDGINKLLEEKKYAANMEFYFKNYETENMKPFAVEILQRVINSKLNTPEKF